MLKHKANPHNFELPSLPPESPIKRTTDSGIIHQDQFTRKNLKSVLHLITQELKKRGTKTPHIFLPFRSRIKDYKLNELLLQLAPQGELIQDVSKCKEIFSTTDEFTLMCCLKYFWARLPNSEIIGQDVYREFKRKEAEQHFPKNAFLTIMPKCLSSPAHASIVYDFLDLILNITSNAPYNNLSGRKISKMAGIWAFNPEKPLSTSIFSDDSIETEHDFVEGINNWKKTTDAMFHLVLAFLRAMLPENNAETLKLPKTLQSLLVTSQYPPSSEKESSKSITIPCVCVTTTKPSSTAYDLISKVRQSLTFDKRDMFSKENYTILKNVFEKKSTSEIVDVLTGESRRIIERITEDEIDNKFNLKPGWAEPNISAKLSKKDVPLITRIAVKDVSIQDYYIWAWLSSLASEQPPLIKKIFGRSIVVEVEVLGFQKWIVVTEKTMDDDAYYRERKLMQKETVRKKDENTPLPPIPGQKVSQATDTKLLPLPPTPSEPSTNGEASLGRDVSPEPVLPQELIDVYEQFEQLFGDDEIVFPNSVDAGELMRREQMGASNDAELDMSDVSSRFTKVTVGDMYAGSKSTTPSRKAPPELERDVSPTHQLKQSSHIAIPGLYEVPSETDNRDSKQLVEVNMNPDQNLATESPTYQVKSMLISTDVDAKEEKKKKKKKERKLQKQAEAAQLAAAQAAGFSTILPLDLPPPDMGSRDLLAPPGLNETTDQPPVRLTPLLPNKDAFLDSVGSPNGVGKNKPLPVPENELRASGDHNGMESNNDIKSSPMPMQTDGHHDVNSPILDRGTSLHVHDQTVANEYLPKAIPSYVDNAQVQIASQQMTSEEATRRSSPFSKHTTPSPMASRSPVNDYNNGTVHRGSAPHSHERMLAPNSVSSQGGHSDKSDMVYMNKPTPVSYHHDVSPAPSLHLTQLRSPIPPQQTQQQRY